MWTALPRLSDSFFLLVLCECKEISVVAGDENLSSTFDNSSEKTREATYMGFLAGRVQDDH